MPAITVSFAALPAHVRTARLVALATARRAGVSEQLLDEIRFAVGEACSRAVTVNAGSAEPVVMTLLDDNGLFTVEVRDTGSPDATADDDMLTDIDPAALAAPESASGTDGDGGGGTLPDPLPPGFGLAVISGLVEDVDVVQAADGTTVRLRWPAAPIDPIGT
jgi:serine/threonine-protein kinase RsbW